MYKLRIAGATGLLLGASLFFCAHAAHADITSNLFGWWKFDEGSGTAAADSSGNSNPAVLFNGDTWTAGKIGSFALSQSVGTGGSGGYASTTKVTAGSQQDVSLSAWVYPTNLTGQNGDNAFLSSTGWGEASVLSNGHFRFVDRAPQSHEYTGATIPLNTWTLLTVTCHDTFAVADIVTLYINGAKVQQDTGSGTANCYDNSPGRYYIGTYAPSPGNLGWTGAIDDVRVYYGRTLTDNDVSDIYALGAPASPPAIFSISVSTTTTTATITWTTDVNASSTVKYGSNSSYGSASTTDALVTSHSIILSGLSPSTTYHYQVGSGNTSGVSTSSDRTFTTATPADVTPPVISAVASTTSYFTATVTWTTDEAADSKVAYGTSAGTYTMSTSSASLVTSHSIGLTGLSDGTKYFYVVVSTDVSGNISTSSEKTLLTPVSPDVTPPVISAVASSTNDVSATITWTTDENASSTIRYGLTSAYGSASTTDALVTSHSIILSGLIASTTYHFQIGSTDASGNVSTSSDRTFTTASTTSFTFCGGSCITIHDGDVVALVGDSISSINLYTAYLESYWNLRYPTVHVHFRDASRSGAAIPNYTTGGQYMGQVDPLAPDEVILMMTNNGGYTQSQYAAQVNDIVTNYIVATSSAEPILLDPPPENTADGLFFLSQYSDSIKTFAQANNFPYTQVWSYLHTIWAANLSSSTPVDIQDGGDEDHMGPPAHLGIAYAFLSQLNADPKVSSTTISATTATVIGQENATVSNVATTSQGIDFTRLDARLPMAYDDRSLPIFKIMPQIYDQSKYMLTVSGLSAGDYYVYVDGVPSGSVSSNQLAAGWNMSTMTSGPIHDQLQSVLDKIRTKAGLDRVARGVLSPNTGMIEYISTANSCYIDQGLTGAALKSCVASAISDVNVLDNAIYAAAQPVSRTFSLRKAAGSADVAPPVISNPVPNAPLPQGTTSTTLSVDTDENATCKYDTVAQTPYIWMANTFGTTGGTTSSTTISGLLDGVNYTYYIRCQDAYGNRDMTDYTLGFSVNAEPDPIAHWTFDEGSGTSAADSSGNGHTGTLVNSPTWVSGEVGTHALSFNGTNNAVSVGDISDADGIGAFTVSAWVKGAGSFSGSDNYNVVTKYASGQGPWNLQYSGASRVYACSIVNGIGTGVTAIGTTVALNDTDWHLVTCIYDGTKVVVYTDAATSTNPSNSPALTGVIKNTTYPVCIGTASDGNSTCVSSGSNLWQGAIDDVEIWKRALSSTEVANMYTPDLTPPVISSIASSTDISSATITWSTDEEATSTVRFGATSSYGSASSSDDLLNSHSIVLSGLSASTLYHFQIGSTDQFGNTSTSSDRTFTTADAADLTPPVISSVASSTGDTTATIAWTTNEAATSTVEYGSTSSYGTASTSASLVTSHSILLSGLTLNTLYHFRVSSADASGNRATSTDFMFTTTDSVGPVISSVASSTAMATATVTWTTDEAATSKVSYGISSGTYTTSTSSASLVTSHSIGLTGLSASTQYFYVVVSADTFGNISTSSEKTLLTINNSPVVTTSIASFATSTATLNGSITNTHGFDAIQSGFAYGTSPTLSSVIATTSLGAQVGNASFSSSVAGLSPNTLYYYRSYAQNTQGTGYGSIQSFTTNSVSIPTVTTQATDSFTVTGATAHGTITATGNINPKVRGFVYGTTLSYGASTTENGDFGVGAFSATLSGLTCNTLYHIAAYASSTQGIGYGSDATFTAPCLSLLSAITSASLTSTSQTITWTSDVPASSKIDFGIDNSYGSSTLEVDISPRVLSHSIVLSPLLSCSVYHYRVRSKDVANTQVLGPDTVLTTSGCTASAPVSTSTDTVITTGSGGTLDARTTSGTGLELSVPTSFSSTTVRASFQSKRLDSGTFFGSVAAPSGLSLVGSYLFNLGALSDATTSLHSFDHSLTISITYADSDVANFDVNTLVIKRYDGASWIDLTNCSTDLTAKTVTCDTDGFSDFGLFGVFVPPPSNPGTITSSSSSGGGGGGAPFTPFKNPFQVLCQFGICYQLVPATTTSVTATTTLKAPTVPISVLSLANVFKRNLYLGMTGNDVKQLQIFLNIHGFTVAKTGAGSKGHETMLYGPATEAAVNRFQQAYADYILVPGGYKRPTGTFGPSSRAMAIKLSQGLQ